MATIDDISAEIRVMCGNRLDMDAMSASCANQAVVTMLNQNEVPLNQVLVDATVDDITGGIATLDFPATGPDPGDPLVIEAVTSVSYINADSGNVVPIGVIHPIALLDMSGEAIQYPTGYVVLGNKIHFYPFISGEFDVRILGIGRYYYLSGGDIIPIADSLRPALVAIGTAIAKVYLGEPEVGSVLNQLASLLGQARFGPKGKQDESSAFGLQVRR